MGFSRHEKPGVAENGLRAQQSMQMPAAGSLSTTQDPPEMRDTTRVSLWDELSHTDVSETQTDR